VGRDSSVGIVFIYFGSVIFIKFLHIRNFDKDSKSAELFSGQIKAQNAALNAKGSAIF
jgi:hypothetical protein